MYWTFLGSLACTFLLSYPATDYIVHRTHGDIHFTLATALPVFVLLLMGLAFFMAIGKAAVYKHIPVYYPDRVGVVGGAVGAIGGLGGFALPLAFGIMNEVADVWTSCFMLLFGIGAVSLVWMHFAIRRQQSGPRMQEPAHLRYLPELKAASDKTGASVEAAQGPSWTSNAGCGLSQTGRS
jgi:NNP family nitrate/nitrite transporter-like MFS transporter